MLEFVGIVMVLGVIGMCSYVFFMFILEATSKGVSDD